MQNFKSLLFFLILLVMIFYSCGTKKKLYEEFTKIINQNITKDEITISTLFGKVIQSNENSIVLKLDKKKKELILSNNRNLEDYFLNLYKTNCLNRHGRLEVIDEVLNKKLSDMIYNQLQSNEFPDVYLKEYLKNDYSINSILVKKYYNIKENILLFCYLPDEKRFYTVSLDKDKGLIKLFRGSVLKILPKYAKEESEKLKRKIQEIISRDLENLIWFSLNLPLIYKGVKLYYFEARPVYETEEDKRANLGTDRWDIYLKLKNNTYRPFIFNFGKITFIKEGKDYKPLFKIDIKGNIKGVEISGNCQRVENNKVIIPPNGKCNIYYIYDRVKKEGGLKFIGLKDLKGGVLVIDKYPIYIWSMTTYDMKLEGLSVGE